MVAALTITINALYFGHFICENILKSRGWPIPVAVIMNTDCREKQNCGSGWNNVLKYLYIHFEIDLDLLIMLKVCGYTGIYQSEIE